MQVSDHGTHEARKRALLGEAYDRVNAVRIENIVEGRARAQRRLSTDHCILEVSLAG